MSTEDPKEAAKAQSRVKTTPEPQSNDIPGLSAKEMRAAAALGYDEDDVTMIGMLGIREKIALNVARPGSAARIRQEARKAGLPALTQYSDEAIEKRSRGKLKALCQVISDEWDNALLRDYFGDSDMHATGTLPGTPPDAETQGDISEAARARFAESIEAMRHCRAVEELPVEVFQEAALRAKASTAQRVGGIRVDDYKGERTGGDVLNAKLREMDKLFPGRIHRWLYDGEPKPDGRWYEPVYDAESGQVIRDGQLTLGSMPRDIYIEDHVKPLAAESLNLSQQVADRQKEFGAPPPGYTGKLEIGMGQS